MFWGRLGASEEAGGKTWIGKWQPRTHPTLSLPDSTPTQTHFPPFLFSSALSLLQQATVATILEVQAAHGVTATSLLNFVISDGATMIATRFVHPASERAASLYYAEGACVCVWGGAPVVPGIWSGMQASKAFIATVLAAALEGAACLRSAVLFWGLPTRHCVHEAHGACWPWLWSAVCFYKAGSCLPARHCVHEAHC